MWDSACGLILSKINDGQNLTNLTRLAIPMLTTYCMSDTSRVSAQLTYLEGSSLFISFMSSGTIHVPFSCSL